MLRYNHADLTYKDRSLYTNDMLKIPLKGLIIISIICLCTGFLEISDCDHGVHASKDLTGSIKKDLCEVISV